MSNPANPQRCCLYLRSSKDRHDVSIEAQRRELLALAEARGLVVVREFSDVVVSGATENRPGWQELLRELKTAERGWSSILALDTSRIARNQWIAHGLRHECKKRGVTLLFSKTPELDGVAGVILPAVLHAMDEVHSMLSREKGLAGMAENVRRGFRAGGRAPYGYRLEAVATGAMREGSPVHKTRLVATEDAPAIAQYLKGRALGLAGTPLARQLGIRLERSSLISTEWCALTYAGHTVWNVNAARGPGKCAYLGGRKRRPRAEWQIQRDTHEALITEAEAETILARLEQRTARMRDRGAEYLLSGLLVTPAGDRWWGDKGYYRCRRRRLTAPKLEQQLVAACLRHLAGDAIVRATAARARQLARPDGRQAERDRLEQERAGLDRQIARLTELLGQAAQPRPLLAQIDALERRREPLARRLDELGRELAGAQVLALITEEDVRATVRAIADGLADQLAALPREDLKAKLRAIVDRIEIDPETLSACVTYAIPAASGVKVASRRERSANPASPAPIIVRQRLQLTGFRRAA